MKPFYDRKRKIEDFFVEMLSQVASNQRSAQHGFCAILLDGTVKCEVHHYRNLKVVPLDDNIPEKIPCYNKVVKAVKFLYTRFP